MRPRNHLANSPVNVEIIRLCLYAVLIISLVFVIRALTNISLVLLIFQGLTSRSKCKFLQPKYKTLFFCLAIFILIQAVGSFYSADTNGALKNLQQKTGMLFAPLALLLSPLSKAELKSAMLIFATTLGVAACYCISIAAVSFLDSGNASVFTYHQLVSPINQHAIYLSFLIIFLLIFYLKSPEHCLPARSIQLSIICFFTAFLLLLASKLMIILYTFYLIFHFIREYKFDNKRNARSAMLSIGVAMIVLITITMRGPVSDRFRDVVNTDLSFLQNDSYQPSDYFNGIQFRLLQWKIAGKILNEKDAWLLGIGPGGSQQAIDNKYREMNMFTGDGTIDSRGYLGYNAHNQMLETLIQNGLLGVIMFVAIAILIMRILRNNVIGLLAFLVICIWSFSESILETQYGIIYFFLPLLFVSANQELSQPISPKKRLD